MSFWQNPAVVGLIIAIPSAVLGYLGYRRSKGLDSIAKQAGIATTEAMSIGQVVDGLNGIIARLQEDNKVLRGDIETIRKRLDRIESLDLEAKNRELERENRILHAENEAFKIEIEELKARIDELERANGPS